MITAHLPSGYLLSRAARWRGPVMLAALVGAVWPDIDLFFFYFVDDRALHHHRYWVHAPAFVLVVSLALLVLTRWRWSSQFPLAVAFCGAWGLHILLDSLAGDIMWLWPFSTQLFALFTVPAIHENWIVSFLLHWTFLAELAIWATTLTLLIQSRRA